VQAQNKIDHIRIPKFIAESYNLKAGSEVVLTSKGDILEIRPVIKQKRKYGGNASA